MNNMCKTKSKRFCNQVDELISIHLVSSEGRVHHHHCNCQWNQDTPLAWSPFPDTAQSGLGSEHHSVCVCVCVCVCVVCVCGVGVCGLVDISNLENNYDQLMPCIEWVAIEHTCTLTRAHCNTGDTPNWSVRTDRNLSTYEIISKSINNHMTIDHWKVVNSYTFLDHTLTAYPLLLSGTILAFWNTIPRGAKLS